MTNMIDVEIQYRLKFETFFHFGSGDGGLACDSGILRGNNRSYFQIPASSLKGMIADQCRTLGRIYQGFGLCKNAQDKKPGGRCSQQKTPCIFCQIFYEGFRFTSMQAPLKNTVVRAYVKINPASGTAEEKKLMFEEMIPPDYDNQDTLTIEGALPSTSADLAMTLLLGGLYLLNNAGARKSKQGAVRCQIQKINYSNETLTSAEVWQNRWLNVESWKKIEGMKEQAHG
ncbi:MAG: hypothetical protein HUU50_00630 [Candidatus Brocadiae bacterium]|nr:hypothetical protein [Candidatus Brocadiia bacterium]